MTVHLIRDRPEAPQHPMSAAALLHLRATQELRADRAGARAHPGAAGRPQTTPQTTTHAAGTTPVARVRPGVETDHAHQGEPDHAVLM
jgi:hypothetical protein